MHGLLAGRGPQELDRVLGGHRAGWLIESGFPHEMPGRGPVRMAIQKRTDDSAVEHPRKRFVMWRRHPVGDYARSRAIGRAFFRDDASDPESLGIGRPAAETGAV